MKPKKFCSHCGAKMVEYKHTLSKGLAAGLKKMAMYAGRSPIHIKELGLTYNQMCNFQKLRYWGLVSQCSADGERDDDDTSFSKDGYWVLTDLGVNFIQGEVRVPKAVWTYRGNFRREEEKSGRIYFEEISDGYENRADYWENARGVR